MGIREWPQQQKRGEWKERVQNGQTLVRYVLDGKGSVTITDAESSKTAAVAPGSLIEVADEATLEWTAPGNLLILTPGYEEAGLFVGVLAALVVLSVAGVTLIGPN